MSVEVDAAQLREILVSLDPKMYSKEITGMMHEAKNIGQPVMEKSIDGGLGIAVRSIGAKATPLSAEIYSTMNPKTGMLIEQGRSPGNPMSLLAAIRWVTGHKASRLKGYSEDEIQQGYAVMEAVRAGGSKGKFYLKATFEVLEKAVPKMLKNLGDKIAARWGK
jgi:hypothetical protein